MLVHLVENAGNNPGRVYAILSNKEDADNFAESVEAALNTECLVIARTLYYGQPPYPGYCK
jgi:hypothetical protein